MLAWTTIDLVLVSVYLTFVLALGVWIGRGERDASDYFLAGRGLPWYLIGFSFYASNMSGASFVGLIGASYAEGMVVFNYEWTATLVLIVFALVMLPTFLRCRLFTVPEYLERRFDRRARWVYSGFTLLTLLFIDMAGALYAGGVVISTLFPEVSLWQTTAGLALVAGIYTLLGGLKAVVVTDAMQAVLIILGSVLILVYGLEAAGGWSAVLEKIGPAKDELLRPADDAFLPWPGIFGVLLLGFYYWTMNQYFVQRALAARSLKEAQRGALFGGLLKLPNVLLMVMPGMIALALYPNLENPDRAFPTLAFELLPTGLRGLVLTALIAAIMSSLDSAMNAGASLVTMDFVRPLRPKWSSKRLLAIGRIVTGGFMIIAALYAPVIESFGSLFVYFQATLAYLVPVVVAVYFGGLLAPRITPEAGAPALMVGLALGALLFLAKQVTGLWGWFGLPDLHFTYVALFLFFLTFLILAIASRKPAKRPPDPETLFRRSDLASVEGGLRWGNASLQAAGLSLLLLATLLWFAL